MRSAGGGGYYYEDRSPRGHTRSDAHYYRRHRSRSRSPVGPPKKGKKTDEGGSSSEIDDLTKDQRTVFVSQLVMKASEKQVRSFFEKLGRVKDVIMIRDKYTNRHKGFAYVEMADLESVPMCLMLNGTLPDFQKFPILVKASEAEKNFLAKQEATAAQIEAAERREDERRPPRKTLVVGNLHPDITADDLRTVLAPFGSVEDVDLSKSGLAGGGARALVTFADADDALKASTRIAGIELGADRPITVEFFDEGPGGDDHHHHNGLAGGSSAGGSGAATTDWRLDSDDAGGMAMNAQSRAALMAQLGQRAGLGGEAAYRPVTSAAPPPLHGPPQAAMCMANLFDPSTETEPSWRDDIKADVTAECSKYGNMIHCHVDAVSPRGLVHCLFSGADEAQRAAKALHGRYFAGRAVTVTYVDPRTHRAQFASEF